MNKIRAWIQEHELFAKIGLFIATIVLLVLVLPKEGSFKYEFSRGKPWLHDDLYAPFDFAIIKYESELNMEREQVLSGLKPYFRRDSLVAEKQREFYRGEFLAKWAEMPGGTAAPPEQKERLARQGEEALEWLFAKGIIRPDAVIENKPGDFDIYILEKNIAQETPLAELYTIKSASEFINENTVCTDARHRELLVRVLISSLAHNIIFDDVKTNSEKQEALAGISPFHGMVERGELIISRGARVNDEQYRVLSSLKSNYETQLGTAKAIYAIAGGQLILTSISILVLAMFLRIYRRDILANNKKIFLILLLIFSMVAIASLVVRFNVSYFYLIPVCLVPVIIRVFYDTRLALFVHLITIFITGFIAPNSFQFVFIQLIAGVVAIMSIVRLERRSQFFYTAFWVFCTYVTIYIGLSLMNEGALRGIEMKEIYRMAGNAAMLLSAYPIIFLLERAFNYITDVTLIELANSNNKLLRELALKAPGTFQHSMQVANLAEEASYAIGANSLLTRVGALYHDIGKMYAPLYFVENQVTGVNPHDSLSYEESARIIIRHVTQGMELAKKHKIPSDISDFITTHHGTRKVEYFYIKQKQTKQGIDDRSFTYPGPIPYSRETALVMMADSVEAASRSLEKPDERAISELVDRIIDKQVETEQFSDANLTLKDISKAKEIFKRNLMTIYHVRISYPE